MRMRGCVCILCLACTRVTNVLYEHVRARMGWEAVGCAHADGHFSVHCSTVRVVILHVV